MAVITVRALTSGSNSHGESAFSLNAFATDFIPSGVVGAVSNTSGVAPTTGAFAVNAQSTPNMSVRVTNGVMWLFGTPSGGVSQAVRVDMDVSADVTVPSNSSGSTKYDWLYMVLDASKMANPAADASDVATLVLSRSTSNTVDNGTPPTYGYCVAVITVANGAATIANPNISDSRTRTGANMIAGSVTLPTTTTVNAHTLYNPYKFFAYHNTTQSLGASVQVSFNTEVFDTNNNFASSTYTAPVAGFYYFKAQMYVTGSGSVFNSIAFYKNGTMTHTGGSAIAVVGDVSLGAETVVQLAAGDTMKVYHNNSWTQTIYGQSGTPYHTYFTGFLISTT